MPIPSNVYEWREPERGESLPAYQLERGDLVQFENGQIGRKCENLPRQRAVEFSIENCRIVVQEAERVTFLVHGDDILDLYAQDYSLRQFVDASLRHWNDRQRVKHRQR